jgi:hypothetical protein
MEPNTKNSLTTTEIEEILKENLKSLQRKARTIDLILEMDLKPGQTYLDLYNELIGDLNNGPETKDESK